MKAQLGRQSGMTLIEVMAALVIFALAGCEASVTQTLC